MFIHEFDGYTFKRMLNNYPVEKSSMFCDHFHVNYELLYFLRGRARFEIGARQYQLKPKTLLIIPPGTHHQGFVDPSEDYERIVINFSPRDISPLLLEPLRHCPTALDVAGSELEVLFDEFNLQEEKYRNEILLQEMRKCTLARILLLLCFDDTKSCQEECRNEKLSVVMEYIDNHLTEINTITDIAGGMYISESTIRKMFLEYANIPVMRYVRNKRILLGRTLILNGVKPQKACEQCGFQNYSTFFRVYKKHCGESPSDTYQSVTNSAQKLLGM